MGQTGESEVHRPRSITRDEAALIMKGYDTKEDCCFCIKRVYPPAMKYSDQYMCPLCGCCEKGHYVCDCRCSKQMKIETWNQCFFACFLFGGSSQNDDDTCSESSSALTG